MSYSSPFTIAPYFSISLNTGSILQTQSRVGMNITNDAAYFDVWVRPYRFPTAQEQYYPIIEKAITGNVHYSLRLNPDGTLSFIVTSTAGVAYIARTTTDLALVRPNSIDNDSA